jgi:transketolase
MHLISSDRDDIALNTLRPLANAIRVLTMDAVEKAQSGHPGMPMGMADVATVLFARYFKFDPMNPFWPDRDRFVLSAGHGSMLLYALNYLTGYQAMSLEHIQNFRRLHSLAAGHPEFNRAAGIEMTTGPLGQGIATAVGMALAERMLAARFGNDLVDHRTWVIASDGCLMEGLSHEAISLAGHLRLQKLTILFDDNHISIDGPTSLTVSDNQLERFKASQWFVQTIDGHDYQQIDQALSRAQQSDRPSLIACRTVLAYGAPNKAGSAAAHGAPLGATEIQQVRDKLNWPWPPFEIPAEILKQWRAIGARGRRQSTAWDQTFNAQPPALQVSFKEAYEGILPSTFQEIINECIQQFKVEKPHIATRQSSGLVLEQLTAHLPYLIGGSADLTGSNNTKPSSSQVISSQNHYQGQYLHYGVREHGMGAIMNGLALHGGFIPYGGTFLVFSDYCRPALRLSALMKQRVIYVMTHDSIGLGEDGPTHQPIEHLASLRAMPDLQVFRPADAVEVAECWALALQSPHTPSVLALTRQAVPFLRTEEFHSDEWPCRYGAYILRSSAYPQEQVRLFATGSEVSLAIAVQTELHKNHIGATVVSMPCWSLFEQQSAEYRQQILGPNACLRVGIEAASAFGWAKYVGEDGLFFGLERFGASAPYRDLYAHFGLTVDNITRTILTHLNLLKKGVRRDLKSGH